MRGIHAYLRKAPSAVAALRATGLCRTTPSFFTTLCCTSVSPPNTALPRWIFLSFCMRLVRTLVNLPSSSMKKIYTAVIRPRIEWSGMEWRTDSKTPTLTRLIFEKTWNNASSPPEEVRLPHSCASLQNTWKVSFWSFVLITSLPHIEHIWLFAQKALLSCPLYKKICHSQKLSAPSNYSLAWNTLPFDVQSSKSLGMFKSKLKTHLSL